MTEDCKILGGMEKVTKKQVVTLSHNSRIGGASNDIDQVAGWKSIRMNIVLGSSLPYGNTSAFRYAWVQK